MDDIYTRTPVNKSAALVTSQGGCSDKLTRVQERENLVAKMKSLEAVMLSHPKGSKKRKELSREKHALQNELSKYKDVTYSKDRRLGDYILYLVKNKMTKAEWDLTVKKAVELQDSGFEV